MRDIGGQSFTNMKVVISTRAESVGFVVESSSNVIYRGTVTSTSPVVVNIPSELQVRNEASDNRLKGIHVYSSGNESILLLAETVVEYINHGAFLVYPCQTFETESVYEYVIVSVDDPTDTIFSEFLLVGCENSTNITIIPSQPVKLPVNLQSSSSTVVTIPPGTSSHHLLLHQMQTLLVTSFDDLTSTRIVSNKPLTVLSGHECANIPPSEAGCEPLAVQIPPTFTWGTKFLLAPFSGRGSAQIFKAVSSEKDTSFTYRCGSSGAIKFGNVSLIEFNSDAYCHLDSTKPVFLVQFSVGSTLDSFKGDPAVAIIPPMDQHIRETKFISLPTNDFSSNFVSVTVAAEYYNPQSILLDSMALTCEWQTIKNSSGDIVGYGCSIGVTSGSDMPVQHTISHSQGGLLSVLAYGFNTFPSQGYAYLTGQQLKITEGINL